jgi:hypothetical protein
MVGEPQVAMRVTSQIWQVVFASQTLSIFRFSLRKKAQYVVMCQQSGIVIIYNKCNICVMNMCQQLGKVTTCAKLEKNVNE